MKILKLLTLIILTGLVLSLAACGEANPVENNIQQDIPENTTAQNQPDNPKEHTTVQNEEPAEVEAPDTAYQPLNIGPLDVEISTEDQRQLEGYYYPAKNPDAPVVVLLHWAPGNMDDWEEIARWLQNRQDEIGMAGSAPIILTGFNLAQALDWTDHTWFPPMPEEISFAVLAVNYGGYGDSIGGRETWLLDAQAAVHYAASLPEVDPHQISALGASIGADGVVDGCYLFNDLGEMGTCIGAFSLSPGNYLTDEFTYTDAAAMLDQEGYPVWCLAAEGDYESAPKCFPAKGTLYKTFIFPGNFHGMRLIEQNLYPLDPRIDFNVLQLVQEWLEEVYLLTLNEFDLDLTLAIKISNAPEIQGNWIFLSNLLNPQLQVLPVGLHSSSG